MPIALKKLRNKSCGQERNIQCTLYRSQKASVIENGIIKNV